MMSFNRENASNCPCKDCEGRHEKCHSHCDSYKEWRAKLDQRNENARASKTDIISDATKRAFWRSKRYGAKKNQNRIRDN